MGSLKKYIASGLAGLLFTSALMLCMQGAQAAIAFRAASSAGIRQATISYRATGTAASAASGNITPILSGSSLNYFLICIVEQHDNVAISFPAGWKQLYSISTTATHRASAYYKMAAAAEANPLITHTGGNSIIAQCSTFRGVDPVNPLDVAYAAQYAASSTSVTSGSLTTLTANDWMLFAPHIANNPTIVAPAGAGGVTWTQQYYSSTTLGLRSAVGLYTGTKATAGAVGPITSTISAASENNGVLMALHDGSRLSIAVPTGTVAGDVMIAAISTTPSSVPITAPAGWTLIQAVTQATATSNRVSTYYRVAGASEPASYSWTLNTTHTGAAGGIVSYSGVNNTTPVDVSAGQATASSLNHSAPSITTTVANDMLVTVHEYASASSWTPPAGMAERVDIASRSASTSGITLEMNELSLGAAGATGAKIATAAASADTGGTVSIALRPAAIAPDHIEIDYPLASLSTCSPTAVTVYACGNAACSSYYTLGTSVTLSPGGNVVSIPSGSGSGSGTVLQTTAGAATLNAVSVPAALGATTCKNTSSGTFNCGVNFTAATLTVTVPNLTAGKTVTGTISGCTAQVPVASNPININFYTAYNNPASGTLKATVNGTTIGTSAATSVGINLTFSVLNATTNQATFSLSYPDVGLVNLYACKPNCTTPSASGNGPFTAGPDHFVLSSLKCGNGVTYAGCVVTSPYANPGASNNSGAVFMKASNPTISPFASYPFSMTVTAYNGAATPAVTPNFGKEISAESVDLTPAANMPDMVGVVTTGNLTGSFGAFSSGVASGNAFAYDEAGIMTITPSLHDPDAKGYLSMGNQLLNPVGTTSGTIGRFIPDHFTITTDPDSPIITQADFLPQTSTTIDVAGVTAPATSIPVAATAGFYVGDTVRIPGAGAGGAAFTAAITAINSAASPPTLTLNTAIGTTLVGGENVFDEWGSYMGEQFNAQFNLTAVELNGSTTNNYQSVYAKLNPSAAGNPLGFGAVNDPTGTPTYSLPLDTSLTASGAFNSGSATINAPLVVTRGASAVGPYNLVQVGIAPTDVDGVKMGGPDAYGLGVSSATFDHTSIMEPLVQNVTSVLYGQTKISNAYGSELLPLPIPLTLQYWNGINNYVTNGSDSQTSIFNSNISLSNYQKNLTAGATTVSPASVVFISGASTITLSAPGNGKNGSVDMSIPLLTGAINCSVAPPPLGCYLPSNTARATFGVYKGANEFIYLRENY
jgi:hypothetical protein